MIKENIELLEVVKRNPDLEIKFLVAYEVVCEDYGYWLANIECIEVSKYWEYNERIYTERHYYELLDEIEVCSTIEDENEFFRYRDKILSDNYKGKAIFVFIGV